MISSGVAGFGRAGLLRGVFVMKKIIPIIALFVFMLALFGVAEAGRQGDKTINLRACIDVHNDNACSFNGDIFLDGVTVCFKPARGVEQCGQTEDGEWWFDSLPAGTYMARTEGLEGYQFVGASCTTFPNVPYSQCQINGSKVKISIRKSVNAVNVNFLFVAEQELTRKNNQ
jgi:hypothetical protein